MAKRWRRPKIINLYLMWVTGTNVYKIGYTSKHPKERMKAISFQWREIAPVEIIDFVECEFKYEKIFHDRFKSMNFIVRGWREYFLLDEYSIDLMKSFFISKKNKLKDNG